MPTPDPAITDDLAELIGRSPSSFHAAAELVRRLEGAGFQQAEPDQEGPGKRYLVRDGTVLAWYVPAGADGRTPLRIVAAHTDSPTWKLKPRPDLGTAGWLELGVEIYGGPLWNSWLDRDLGLAGRLALYDGTTVLVDIDRPLLRIPQLAIHLDRQVNSGGLTLDPQTHIRPVWGIGTPTDGRLIELVAEEAGVAAADVAAFDLILRDVVPPARLGLHRELLAAPRIDNLSSSHAGLLAFLAAADRPDLEVVPVYAAFDHEEVGSDSLTGANGALLPALLERISADLGASLGQRAETFAASRCLSADAAHAVHPNYLERHDPPYYAVPNQGPAVKLNASQRYATDAVGGAAWARACRQADVPSQVYVTRNNIPCGSTVGPLLTSRLGIRAVDVGIPCLSMHSVRELCGVDDPGYLAAATTAFLTDPTP